MPCCGFILALENSINTGLKLISDFWCVQMNLFERVQVSTVKYLIYHHFKYQSMSNQNNCVYTKVMLILS